MRWTQPPWLLLETLLPPAGMGPISRGTGDEEGVPKKVEGRLLPRHHPKAKGRNSTPALPVREGCREGLWGCSRSTLILNRKEGREY